jgi:LysM repeat protein
LIGGALGAVALIALAGIVLTRRGALDPAAGTTATTVSPPVAATASPPPPALEGVEATPEAPGEPSYYTVEPGDSLGTIADQFDTSIDALIRANNLENADLLSVGQRLIIPQ